MSNETNQPPVSPPPSNHQKLVIAARDWLRKGFSYAIEGGRIRRRCSVVISEMTALGDEQPDAIGWYQKWTHLVEVKASRADFLSDRKKLFRYALPESGMGDFRWYFTLPNVIKPDDTLPENWGHVVYDPDRLTAKIVRVAEQQPAKNAGNEALMLLSLIRRQGKQVNCSIEYHTIEGKGRAAADIVLESETL